ncbi:MAG: two-component system response regulator [Deltaproteobacteria bacterium]|nr:two-component system response regulator [Deltaproteobacteria bacterium]
MDKKRRKILLVDDNPENIQILLETLGDEFAVVAARSGEKALALAIAAPHPDIILLDVMMPNMDGYEVCRRLKANPLTRSIPVLFVTSLNDIEDEQRGLEMGAVDYIIKPFRPELIKARVRNQIDLKQYRDHLEQLVGERTRELSLTQDATIFTVANLAETRDPDTGAHIWRTQQYVRILALHLAASPRYAVALTPPDIDLLFKSAPLHDIGKIGIADHILLKPGKLTPEEFEEMKKHSILGWRALNRTAQLLGSNSFLRYACEIALTHHEKWDGSGYPHGLFGEAIPLSGRLMAVADVYDALISHRPYKNPFPHAEAAALIIDGRGHHFDPAIIDVFITLESEFQQISEMVTDVPADTLELTPEIAVTSTPSPHPIVAPTISVPPPRPLRK